MKHIELFESILEEGLSPVLYHATSIGSLKEIFRTNQFLLTPTFTKQAEDLVDNKRKMYFLSTARTRTGKYTGMAYIELDGRRLAQNLKGSSVDYFGPDYRGLNHGAYEQEDRVLSNDNTIKNALSFITRVDINLDHLDPKSKHIILEVIRIAKTRGIAIGLYNSHKDLIARQRPVTISEYLDSIGKKVNIGGYYRHRRRPNQQSYHDHTLGVFQALKFDSMEQIPQNDRKHIQRTLEAIRYREPQVIYAEFHNASSRSSDGYRNILREISILMRKLNLRNLEDVVKFIQNKWMVR